MSLLNNKQLFSNILKIILLIILIFFIIFNSFNHIHIDKQENKTINIEIRGEVKKEGIYEFPYGITYNDLFNQIEILEEGDISIFNKNQIIYDKEVITIPKIKEYKLISINNASIDELISIKGIGIKTAERIIEYRNEYGSFKQIDDLMNISGIGIKKFERIKEYITL